MSEKQTKSKRRICDYGNSISADAVIVGNSGGRRVPYRY